MDRRITRFVKSSDKRAFFQNLILVNALITLLVLLVPAAILYELFYIGSEWNLQNEDFLTFLIFFVAALIALFVFFSNRKIYDDFFITNEGINVGKSFYPWKEILHYHWLGEAQEERVGMLGFLPLRFDPLNPYRLAGVWVVRLRLSRPWYHRAYLNLGVDPSKAKDLEQVLQEYGVKRLSYWHLALFGARPFQVIAYLVIPAIVIATVIILANLACIWGFVLC